MTDNFLTPAEIEALLGYVAPADNSQRIINASPIDDDVGGAADKGGIQNLSTAERKRRNRLWAIHELAARDTGIALSAMLRAAVDVRMSGIDAISCHSFVTSMETPTCAYLLRSPTLPGQFVLELHSTTMLPMLDRMLGGSVDTAPPAANRRLSEIEQRLAMRLAACIADEFSRAWCSVFLTELAVDRVETDARWLTVGPPESEAVVTTFDVRLGNARGLVRFAIPPQAMDVLEQHLVAVQENSIASPHFVSADRRSAAVEMTELTVELSPSPITAEDIANLAAGDVITTEHRIDAPVNVNLDGEPKYLGRLAATAGRKAVRIAAPTDQSEPRP